MWRLLAIVLTVVSLSAMSFAASAHAARMAGGAHASHRADRAPDCKDLSCDETGAMSRLCEWVCLGGAPPGVAEMSDRVSTVGYLAAPPLIDTTLAGVEPLLHDRPPKPRLL